MARSPKVTSVSRLARLSERRWWHLAARETEPDPARAADQAPCWKPRSLQVRSSAPRAWCVRRPARIAYPLACHRPSLMSFSDWTKDLPDSARDLLRQSGPQSTLQGFEQGLFIRPRSRLRSGCTGFAQDRGQIGRKAALRHRKCRDFDSRSAHGLDKGTRRSGRKIG